MNNKFLEGLLPYPVSVTKTAGVFVLADDMPVCVSEKVNYNFAYWLSKLGIKDEEKAMVPGCAYALTVGSVGTVLAPESPNKDAYRLVVTEGGIAITGNSDAGLSYALKTLVKIQTLEGCVPCMVIEDAPMVDMRAIHMCLFNPHDGSEKDDTSPEVVKKRIELAALMGYNYVFVEFWGMFPYERHPYACHPDTPYTKAKIEELVSFCINDLHITPCPGQNLTSHAGWSRIATRLHVVLDQRPDLAERYIPGGWCFATENPDTKAFLRDCIDELCEAFHNPPMLHMGCDKAFGFGSTEEDRTKSADILFAQHIANLNTYITAKGVRPVMWSDMLYTSMDSLTFKVAPFVADHLSKSILMDVWTHNDPGEYWHDIDFFEDKGYQTVYSPFINYKSIENMVKMCIHKKSKGIIQTTWHRPEMAKPYFVYSGAKQWNFNTELDEQHVKAFLATFDT